MTTAVLTFVFFLLFMTIMAIGFLVKRRPLQKRCSADLAEPCICTQERDGCTPAKAEN